MNPLMCVGPPWPPAYDRDPVLFFAPERLRPFDAEPCVRLDDERPLLPEPELARVRLDDERPFELLDDERLLAERFWPPPDEARVRPPDELDCFRPLEEARVPPLDELDCLRPLDELDC